MTSCKMQKIKYIISCSYLKRFSIWVL